MDNDPVNISPSNHPLWVESARHYIGTEEDSFLEDAIRQCEDAAIRNFLVMIAGMREREGYVSHDLQRLANEALTSLMAESRMSEATVVELLVRRSAVRLATLNIHAKATLPEEAQEIINFSFNRGFELARQAHFEECEAFFARMLGDYERSLGNWEAASGAHGHSMYLYSNRLTAILGNENPNHTLARMYLDTGLAVMLDAAISTGKAGHEELAFQLLKQTTDLYRNLRSLGSVRRGTALGAFRAFHELARIRQLRAAVTLGDVAVEMCRDLCKADPQPQHTYDLALCLSEMGQFHAQLGDPQQGRTLCSEGVHLLEGLVEQHPWFFQGPLALAYTALAHVNRLDGDPAQALFCFEQSVSWLRRASAQQDDPNRIQNLPYLIDALNNYGSACRDAGKQEQAIEAFEEALVMIDDLRATTPYVLPKEWMTYGNLCLLLASEERFEEAWSLGERAMALLEADKAPDHELWLEKGVATNLYIHMFERYALAENAERAFRCLVALRTAGWALSNEEESKALGDSLQQVRTLSQERGKAVTVVCPQTLLGSRMMMAILRSDADSIEFVDCSSFIEPAFNLWRQVLTGEEDDGDQDCSAVCAAAAERAWAALPAAIQCVLAPPDGGQILICGDDNWTAFPWEALKFGPSSLDLLGLRYSLPRWHSPDASALAAIEGKAVDGCSSGFAVVCPWNATDVELESARREAVVVTRILESYAKPGADQVLLLGEDATEQAMTEVVTKAPEIIHYAGHGDVASGEEVLLLYNTDQHPTFWGRRELHAAAVQTTPMPPREGRARLVVLNCCYGGRARSFGGRREDLASAFLRSGVSSVIASATPVNDQSAGILGVCLHHRFGAEEETVSDVAVRARRLVARCMQALGENSWATWCTIVYHGNPFLIYRRSRLSGEPEKSEIASSIAATLADVVTSVRGRQIVMTRIFEEILRDEIAGV